MATKVKPWPTGGNVTLTYGGQGNSPVVIESDDNPTDEARSMVVTIETTAGSPVQTAIFTVSQAAGPNFRLKNGAAFIPKNSDFFNVKT